MEPGQASPTPERPRRRWYQDLGQKDEKKSAMPSHSSDSRPRTPSPPPSTPKPHNKAWVALQATLEGLRNSAKSIPGLHPAIAGLALFLSSFETATRHRQDCQRMISDLHVTLQFLKRHLDASTSTEMTEAIAGIIEAVQEEVSSVGLDQSRGTASRVLTAIRDEEDLLEVSIGDWHATNASQMETRLRDLEPAKLATFNSKLSGEINRRTCTENTRINILLDLNTWSDNPNAEKIFWMDGMAGTGKTTIACTLSDLLQSRGQLAASFFCTRTSPECRDANRIVPTIAYQLARNSTPFRSALGRALEKNPDVVSLNVSAQFDQILKIPLLEVKDKLPNNLVVVIDALDECDDNRVVVQILDALFRFEEDMPIKFFVTSRPEPAIREKMMSPENMSRSIFHLHDIEGSMVQADIELYLQRELEFMSPSPSDVKQLTALADNLFIYAATAVRYIRPGKKSIDPRNRLARVLTANSQLGKMLSHIDSLYSTILSAALDDEDLEPEEKELIQLILRTAVCAREPIPLQTLAALSGASDEGQALAALEPLRSVVHVSEHTGLISTLHASFPDYMFSQDRSDRFFCDPGVHSQLLARRCLEIMKGQLQFNICDLPSSFIPDSEVSDLDARIGKNISPSLFYACRYWAEHLKNAPSSGELHEMIVEFVSQRLLFWMEVLNLKESIVAGARGLLKVQAWLKATGSTPDSIKFATDAYKFVARFVAHPISISTPHIYISALPLCPPSSLVSVHYQKRTQGLIEVKGTAIIRMGQAALASWQTNSEICCVAYSPDGAQVVSGSDDGTICIRNANDGKIMVGPFKGHSEALSSIAFSPDGTRIVSGSYDSTINLWDARDGTPLAGPFKGHTRWVSSVAFSPDGARIVSGSNDCTIRVWLAHDGTPVASPFRGHTHPVTSAKYSPDGTRIASSSDDCTVRLWDANSGTLIHSLEGHSNAVNSVAFSPDGEHLASGSLDWTVRLWNVRNGTPTAELEGHTKSIQSVAYSPNGALVVSGSRDQTIRVWDAHKGTIAYGPFEGHIRTVDSVDFSPDGTQIVSGSADQTICIWNVFDSPPAAIPSRGHSSAILSAEFSPDGVLIASGAGDNTVRVWSALDGTPVAGPFEGHEQPVLLSTFSPDSTHILAAAYDNTFRLWHAHEATLVSGPVHIHNEFIVSAALSFDGSRVVTASNSESDIGNIRMWDLSSGALIAGPFQKGTTKIYSVALSPDGTSIASGHGDGTIGIWNAFDGAEIVAPIQGHSHYVTCVRFSSDGSRIVSAAWDMVIHIWDARNGQLIAGHFEGHAGRVSSVAFSPDGALVVSGSADCTVRLWNSHDGSLVAPPLQGHTGLVNDVGFSPDGLSIISGCEDQTIRVWEILGKSTSMTLADTWDVRDDGWALNDKAEMLFWVPTEIQHYFPRPNNPFTIGPLGSVQVDLDGVLLGEAWSNCWLGA
ncbi:Vegetative incompatibility protein HET-E-1 [Ceratobasidium theobromae]|uniref:Vegetative incompatibility protein HET-E-1 n=1 Tax=Ceratobasidium theobromae TaxID=1582974 RepID=A0A5N5QC39_9AGAM|nr:Vegetative incompatibility protein HET-E-1 [Ceratobasidium theobromae]